MIEVQIRQYQDDDLESCRGLWVELAQRHRDIYGDQSIGGEEPWHHFDEHLSKVGNERVWVAELEGEIVGMVGIMRNHDDEIEPLVVASEHRNKGIGSKLLEYAIEKAKDIGITYLSIRPVARNHEAISLFYRTGFRKLGHIEMVMDLQETRRIEWKTGPDIFGHSFEH